MAPMHRLKHPYDAHRAAPGARDLAAQGHPAYTPDDDWPTCSISTCDEQYNPRRHDLGYTTCLAHSHRDPNNAQPPLIIQDVNKSNGTVTRRTDWLGEAYADRKVASDVGPQRSSYVHLPSYSNPKTYDKE